MTDERPPAAPARAGDASSSPGGRGGNGGAAGGGAGGAGRGEVAQLLERAVAACRPPAPFERSEAPFWDDPHIGRHLLAAHLDDDTPAASRSGAELDRTVAHLVARGLVGPGVRVLDLGCGPGLVATRLARLGCRVTGVDLSATSLDHARRAARAEGLEIEYRRADFRELADTASFDLVLQSYGELSTFAPDVRDDLLARVRRALVPGGAFVFDVSRPRLHPPTGRSWDLSPGGFWRPGPHLVLEERFVTPAPDGTQLACDQYVVVDAAASGDAAGARVTTYRMWFHDHTPESLTAVLTAAGLAVEELWDSLAGDPPTDDGEWLAVLARVA